MARFDVHRAPRGQGYLLDCQSNLLNALETRAVVPLLSAAAILAATRLNPVFEIESHPYVMQTPMIFSIPNDRLGAPITSLAERDLEIIGALDMLISGF